MEAKNLATIVVDTRSQKTGLTLCKDGMISLLLYPDSMERSEYCEDGDRAEYKNYTAFWRGIELEIRHCPCWFSIANDDFVTQYIEVRSQNKRLLPITETGYRSHFLNGSGALDEFGNGPVAFVLWWLDEAAKEPTWKRKEEEDRQGSLF